MFSSSSVNPDTICGFSIAACTLLRNALSKFFPEFAALVLPSAFPRIPVTARSSSPVIRLPRLAAAMFALPSLKSSETRCASFFPASAPAISCSFVAGREEVGPARTSFGEAFARNSSRALMVRDAANWSEFVLLKSCAISPSVCRRA